MTEDFRPRYFIYIARSINNSRINSQNHKSLSVLPRSLYILSKTYCRRVPHTAVDWERYDVYLMCVPLAKHKADVSYLREQ